MENPKKIFCRWNLRKFIVWFILGFILCFLPSKIHRLNCPGIYPLFFAFENSSFDLSWDLSSVFCLRKFIVWFILGFILCFLPSKIHRLIYPGIYPLFFAFEIHCLIYPGIYPLLFAILNLSLDYPGIYHVFFAFLNSSLDLSWDLSSAVCHPKFILESILVFLPGLLPLPPAPENEGYVKAWHR